MLVGKADIHTHQTATDTSYVVCLWWKGSILLVTNWLGQVVLSRGLTQCHGLQTWDRLQHGINYIATSFTNDWPSKQSLAVHGVYCNMPDISVEPTGSPVHFWGILVFCTHPWRISPIYFLFFIFYHDIQFHISRYITFHDIQCVHLSNNNVSALKQ